VRSKTALASFRNARPLCAAADPDKIINDIKATIETAKKLIETPPTKSSYSAEDVKADVANGTINSSKLGQMFADDEDMKKDMMKRAGQINTLKMQLASHKLPEINWDKYNKILSENGMAAGTIDTLKATFAEQEAGFISAVQQSKSLDIDAGTAEVNRLFDGANGITDQFKAVDAKLNADRVSSLAQLEELLHESTNIDTLTIAEILEKNPEWQKAIEEDIKNHNWGSEPPAALAREMEQASKSE